MDLAEYWILDIRISNILSEVKLATEDIRTSMVNWPFVQNIQLMPEKMDILNVLCQTIDIRISKVQCPVSS